MTQIERNKLIWEKQLERNMVLVIEQESQCLDYENHNEYKHDSGVGYPMSLPVIMNDHNEYEYRRCYRGTQRDY